MLKKRTPDLVRVSIGSAIVLGLVSGTLGSKPSTIYLLTFHPGKCFANCGFCPQAKLSASRSDLLSRVTWPAYPAVEVASRIKQVAQLDLIKRICIQAINYPSMFEDVLSLIGLIKSTVNLPISVSCQPIDEDQMRLLRRVGVDRIGIPVDASTEELFNKIKGYAAGGPYVWTRHMEALKSAVKVFGRGRVITHLIVGLGESDADIIHLFQRLVDMGVYPALFAFTPVQGTRLERKAQPSISRYRLIQIAHHLIVHEKIRCDAVKFDETGRLVDFLIPQDKLRSIVKTGKPFMTSGCPNCNRPYYNERAGGPYYNYPRPLTSSEISLVEREIQYGCPPDD